MDDRWQHLPAPERRRAHRSERVAVRPRSSLLEVKVCPKPNDRVTLAQPALIAPASAVVPFRALSGVAALLITDMPVAASSQRDYGHGEK